MEGVNCIMNDDDMTVMNMSKIPDAKHLDLQYSPGNWFNEEARLICESFKRKHEGTRPLVEGRRKQLKSRLEERLWSAACWRDYQLSCVQRSFDSEIELIEKEYEAEKSQLKEKLLADLLEHRRRLLEGRNNGGDDSNKMASGVVQARISAQRKLRNKKNGDGGEGNNAITLSTKPTNYGASSKRRQQMNALEDIFIIIFVVLILLPLGISMSLVDAEIYEDLSLISKDDIGRRHTRSGNSKNTAPASSDIERDEEVNGDIYCKGETVYCFGETLERGNMVIIKTPDSSELVGEITGIGSKDLWISIEDGAKLKITYQQLRAGRYTINLAEEVFS